MEKIEVDINQYKETTLKVLEFFVNFCEQHHLRYYVAYGSAIGAVRHHGFIPWDDDVDVAMPRPDYECFVSICQTADLGKYELVTPQNTHGYYLPIAKLCDKDTTLLEKKHYRCIIGSYIDIFVIDGMANDPKILEETGRIYNYYYRMLELANSYYSFSDLYKFYIKRRRLRIVFSYLKYALNRKKYTKMAIQGIEEISHRYSYETHDMTIIYPRIYGDREFCPKAWLEGCTMMAYETLQVALPSNYEQWLNQLYGDYMKLPPENQRHYQHSKAYCNLEKRERIEDVINKI